MGFLDIYISENEFAKLFDDYADLCGWTWCGYRPARMKIKGVETYRTPIIGQKGLPDRILAHRGRVLICELKTEYGRLSEAQKLWAKALEGFEGYYVFRPSDWDNIQQILK